MIDGAYAGPLATVDGCQLEAPVIQHATTDAKHVGAAAPAPCSIEVGAGMSAAYHSWLNASLAGAGQPRTLQLVRLDGAHAFELVDAQIAALTLPQVDRAALVPVFLELDLLAAQVRAIKAPATGKEALLPARGYPAASLDVQLAGVKLDATSAGPFTVELAREHNTTGLDRDYRAAAAPKLGELPLRVSERAIAPIDSWAQSFLVKGTAGDADERPAIVALSDGKYGRFELRLDRTGPFKADLAPRGDGSRAYALYAESVATAGK
jgi:hypothetical protein